MPSTRCSSTRCACRPQNLVGEVNGGWALAKVTLGNERVSLSGEGALWGQGPTVGDLLDIVRRGGGVRDAGAAATAGEAVRIEGEVLRLIRLRTVSAAVAGRAPGPEASVRKALADDHGQRVMELARDLAGAFGMLADAGPADGSALGDLVAAGAGAGGPPWRSGRPRCGPRAISSRGRSPSVAAPPRCSATSSPSGCLGLPHDVDVEAARSWAESHRAVQA